VAALICSQTTATGTDRVPQQGACWLQFPCAVAKSPNQNGMCAIIEKMVTNPVVVVVVVPAAVMLGRDRL